MNDINESSLSSWRHDESESNIFIVIECLHSKRQMFLAVKEILLPKFTNKYEDLKE